MMNIFRLLGDLSHVVSIFILLLRLFTTRQAAGISLKTQEVGRWHHAARTTSEWETSPHPATCASADLTPPHHPPPAQMFLLVFVTRYLDLFTTYYSIYCLHCAHAPLPGAVQEQVRQRQ